MTIKCYKEMNDKIKSLLRLFAEEIQEESGLFLYAAQRIEDLENEVENLKCCGNCMVGDCLIPHPTFNQMMEPMPYMVCDQWIWNNRKTEDRIIK
jgi:hypothetical protein